MHSARVRRGAVALLTGAALVAAPTVFLLTSASAAGAAITVVSSVVYNDDLDGDVLVGELQNTGTEAAGLVTVDVQWLDSGGAVIDSDSTSSTVEVIPPAPAYNKSPFRARVSPPLGYADYRLITTPTDPIAALNHNFTVTVTDRFDDADSYHHLKGTVKNNNTTTAEFVSVVASLYGADGKIDDQAVELSSSNASLAPGATGTFEVISDSTARPYSTYAILAQSSTPGTAPVESPSPSASSSTSPTPSPTATGTSPSPTATSTSTSPSPSPTATPLPCRTGGGSYAIASSPSYVKIAKGGRIRLNLTLSQAGRVCQAGVRLSLYARGPGTTLFHLSRTASTSSTGKAFFDYTNVRADFRWYALSSGARSATNLVQAR
jgi:hypothetical protein